VVHVYMARVYMVSVCNGSFELCRALEKCIQGSFAGSFEGVCGDEWRVCKPLVLW